MSTRTENQYAIERYVQSIASNTMELAPLAEDAVYGGPMVPEPLRGAAAIRNYLGEISPFISRIKQLRTIIDGDNAALVAEITSIRGRSIQGAWFFELDDGLIRSVQVYFDSRLLIQDLS
jgi:hypothetical protein